MPALDVLSTSIDTAEPRIKVDRLGVLVSGTVNGVLQWDLSLSSGVYIDPVTSTAMLVPIPLTSDWDASANSSDPASEVYRIPLAATTAAGSPNWVEHIPNNLAGNVYLYGLGVNDPVASLATYPKNQPWYFSYFAFGSGEAFLQLKTVWADAVGNNVQCWVYSDGTVQVWKQHAGSSALLVGSGNLARIEGEHAAHKKPNFDAAGSQANAQTNVPVSFVVIPCRQRELLFLCNRGGAFHVVFEDIDKNDPNPVILPPGSCQWQMPNGQAMCSFAPMHHATSGWVTSFIQELREPPLTGATHTTQAYYDTPGLGTSLGLLATLKGADGVTTFAPDGSLTQVRMRVDLAGDGSSSPWLYGCSAVFPPSLVNTDGTHAQVLDSFVVAAELTVPESPAGVQLTITCKQPDALDAVVARSRPVGNRPVVAKIGTVAILTGRTKAPRHEDGPSDDVSRLIWECRDYWKAFETYEILDPIPWDGRGLQGVIQEIAMLPGFPLSMMDVEAFDFTLPTQGQSASGEYAVIPEAGDTASKWLTKLYEDYAKTAIVGWYPSAAGPKMRFKTPAAISTTPDAVIYRTRADAMTIGGYSEAAHWKHVVRDGYREDFLEPEANSLRVTGWDSRIDKAFQVHYRDFASQDPATVPSLRPNNWTGEPYNVAVYDSAITDAATAAYVAGVLRTRLFANRTLADIPCEMQFKADGSPLWRGNLLQVYGRGNFRILTLKASHLIENTGNVIRPTVYTGVYESG